MVKGRNTVDFKPSYRPPDLRLVPAPVHWTSYNHRPNQILKDDATRFNSFSKFRQKDLAKNKLDLAIRKINHAKNTITRYPHRKSSGSKQKEVLFQNHAVIFLSLETNTFMFCSFYFVSKTNIPSLDNSMSSDTAPEPDMTDSGLGIVETSPPMMFADDFQKELESSPEWQEMEKSLKATLAQFNADPTPEAADIPLIKAEEDIGKELEIPTVPSVYELGSSLQNRLGLVDEEFRCEILNQIQDDVINWIRNIFRFQAATVNAYKDPRQPMLKALRCALAVKYNQQNEESPLGYRRYVKGDSVKAPVIYVTDDIPAAWILFFQNELGLPKECFNVHRINDGINGDKTPFDVNKLFKQVQADANDPQKEPTALIGSFGSESGIDDKVESLLHICGKFQIWCHFEGDNIPMLGNFTIPSKSAPVLAANSITLKPSDFCMLGLPSLFCMRSANNPIRCQPWEDDLLPVWTALQLSGAANIRHRINNAMRITNDLVLVLKQFADVNSSVKERVEEHSDADYNSFGDFVKDTMKQLTAPPALH
ncbi:Oidioi.mRNA.OKI2018_I69.chrUn_10.g17259.t2.cds [Oikopleura dioica]|uniref:Oidioi.mRNA.OKI2018_I69.chrUn_10.g17259.t2. cds n=1 Tax=Oikopleura dioica TaxID=34765 RepID=A0ABN7TCC5_OIKDI|nr:Oidioi.mRNA.OKI2018_I69.chrUn_10.g17259.t2.cds [Oikopleura dioica]